VSRGINVPTKKTPTSYRLSDVAQAMVDRLAEHHGCTKTAAVEMAVRALARRDLREPKVTPSPDKPKPKPKGGKQP
jgi:GTP cyclohydrolase FolE2